MSHPAANPGIQQVLQSVRTTLGQMPVGVRVYSDVPDQINEYPAIVVWAGDRMARLGSSSGARGKPMLWLALDVMIDLHVARKDLPHDLDTAYRVADLMPNTLLTKFSRDRFDGTVVNLTDPRVIGHTAANPYEARFTRFEWGNQITIGYQSKLSVAIEEELYLYE